MRMVAVLDPLGLSGDDLERRIRRLLPVFGGAGYVRAIPCCNVNRSRLERMHHADPQMRTLMAEVVSIAHKIASCPICGQDMWIGPTQAKAGGQRLCYECMALVMANSNDGEGSEIVSLNPDADQIPRRFV